MRSLKFAICLSLICWVVIMLFLAAGPDPKKALPGTAKDVEWPEARIVVLLERDAVSPARQMLAADEAALNREVARVTEGRCTLTIVDELRDPKLFEAVHEALAIEPKNVHPKPAKPD